MNKQEVKKHINDAWVCLRKNNQTIPDDLLDDFKLILEKFYSDDAPNAIVPQDPKPLSSFALQKPNFT